MNLRLDKNSERSKEREIFFSGFVFGFALALITALIGYWTLT